VDGTSIHYGDAIQFADKLYNAAAVLCLEFKDRDKRVCDFQPDTQVDFYGLDMQAVLISWPDGKLISRTEGSSLPPSKYPVVLQCEGACAEQRKRVIFPRYWLLEYSQ